MKFTEENIGIICTIVLVLYAIAIFVAPISVRIARDMWQWALM